MVQAIRLEICKENNRAPYTDEDATDYCRRYMEKQGYSDEERPLVFRPERNFNENDKLPEDRRVRNSVEYYEFCHEGYVSLAEAYVLAKNKSYLLGDDHMLTMIYAIEELIAEEGLKEYGNSVIEYFMNRKGFKCGNSAKDFYVPCKPGEKFAVKTQTEEAKAEEEKPSDPAKVYDFERHDAYDVYLPMFAGKEEAIVYCHGGAFKYGDKGDNPGFLVALAERTGMRVYSVGYRNLDEARKIKTMIDDIAAVIDTIAKKDSVSRFHLVGSSSGAYLIWILSLMISNAAKYDITCDYKIGSVILLSGFFLFKDDHPLTKSLFLYPTFQGFPKELKNVEMDYHGFLIPPVLLITGEDDGCFEDSKTLYDAVKRTEGTDIEMIVLKSGTEKADHCFMTERPEMAISKKAISCIHAFIGKKDYKVKAELESIAYSGMPIKGLKFFGPPSAEEISDLQEFISDTKLLSFFRCSAGCVVVNQNGEIHIYSPAELIKRKLTNNFIGLFPIGEIKEKGYLYASDDGKIILFRAEKFNPERPGAAKKINQWDDIGSLLQINLI
jgi:acetyl esterase/lipase